MGGLPLIAIPHPLADNESNLVNAKAKGIAAEIHEALTTNANDLAQRYAAQFLHLAERRLEGGAVCIDEVCAVDPAVPNKSAN